jgi:hypothetical protein
MFPGRTGTGLNLMIVVSASNRRHIITVWVG